MGLVVLLTSSASVYLLYGKADTFNSEIMTHLWTLSVTCAFCTEVGSNAPGSDSLSSAVLTAKTRRAGKPERKEGEP